LIRSVEQYALRAAEDAKQRAAREGKRGGYALRAFLRGYWNVLISQHPEMEPARITFMRGAGLI
jgi:hypothetical protein